MNEVDTPLLIDYLDEAHERHAQLFELANEAECKKALSNLRQLNKLLEKLESYRAKLPLKFENRTVSLLFTQLLKLFPLIIFDLGANCPREQVKWFSRWCSGIAHLMASNIQAASRKNP